MDNSKDILRTLEGMVCKHFDVSYGSLFHSNDSDERKEVWLGFEFLNNLMFGHLCLGMRCLDLNSGRVWTEQIIVNHQTIEVQGLIDGLLSYEDIMSFIIKFMTTEIVWLRPE